MGRTMAAFNVQEIRMRLVTYPPNNTNVLLKGSQSTVVSKNTKNTKKPPTIKLFQMENRDIYLKIPVAQFILIFPQNNVSLSI